MIPVFGFSWVPQDCGEPVVDCAPKLRIADPAIWDTIQDRSATAAALIARSSRISLTRIPGGSALDCEELPGARNPFQFVFPPIVEFDI